MGTYKSQKREIVHMDLDTFFVSVERLLDPALHNRPVVVGGSPLERGVVAGCSYEARAFGVHSAMPLRSAFRLCPEAIFLRGHYQHYSEYSHLVTEILTDISPLVEKSSVDEFFIDLSGCERLKKNSYNWAQEIQKTIRGETRLPLSFGYAANKLVAKIATTQIAKRTTDRHYKVKSGDERSFLSPMPVIAMPGIGEVTSDNLHSYGMERIGQIAVTPQPLMIRLFGKSGKVMHEHSNGIDLRDVIPYEERKSISRENTFPEDTYDTEKVFARLHSLATELAEELRTTKIFARKIAVKLRYSDFHTVTTSQKLNCSNSDKVLSEVAEKLLRKLWTRRIRVRLIGIETSDFLDDLEQLYLFTEEVQNSKLDSVMDAIRSKYGGVISYGIDKI